MPVRSARVGVNVTTLLQRPLVVPVTFSFMLAATFSRVVAYSAEPLSSTSFSVQAYVRSSLAGAFVSRPAQPLRVSAVGPAVFRQSPGVMLNFRPATVFPETVTLPVALVGTSC